jgi:hypothetical protein
MVTNITPAVTLFFLLLLVGHFLAWSFPNGAGDCPAAQPAVGGSHFSKSVDHKDFDLADAPQNFTLTLNGVEVDSKGRMTNFPINQKHTLELKSDGPFKGFLIRLGPQIGVSELVIDYTKSLASKDGDTNAKIQTAHCVASGAGGVTHTNNNEKTSATAILEMTEPAPDMIMDITVVIVNSAASSEYYHSIYSFSAVEDGSAAGPTDPMPASSSMKPNHWKGLAALALMLL